MSLCYLGQLMDRHFSQGQTLIVPPGTYHGQILQMIHVCKMHRFHYGVFSTADNKNTRMGYRNCKRLCPCELIRQIFIFQRIYIDLISALLHNLFYILFLNTLVYSIEEIVFLTLSQIKEKLSIFVTILI